MAERTPLTLENLESIVDRKIREARQEGAFDDLPGSGQPLAQGPYHPDWWLIDKLRREQLSYLPPALELRREVERTLEAVAAMKEESSVRATLEELNARIRKAVARVTKGPAVDVAQLDVEAHLAAWRSTAARAGR